MHTVCKEEMHFRTYINRRFDNNNSEIIYILYVYVILYILHYDCVLIKSKKL